MSWLSKTVKKVTNNAGRIGLGVATGGLSEAYRALKGAGPGDVPGIDFSTVEGRATENANTQRDLLNKDLERRRAIQASLTPKLASANQAFQTGINAQSQALNDRNEAALSQYGTDISKLNESDIAANAAAANAAQERAFRTLPAQQQLIRESLAANGLSRTGSAARQLAAPVANAARAVNDYSVNLENNRLANLSRRGEAVANAGLDTRKQTALARMGLDSSAIQYLNSIGRQDLVNEAATAAGLSQDEAAGLSDISQNLTDTLNQTDLGRQQQAQAQAAAREAKKGGILRSLTGLAGTGLGALFGGPLGASIGGQVGQTVGGLATGQETQFDPTLLYALQQRRSTGGYTPRNPTEASFNQRNIIRALGGGY